MKKDLKNKIINAYESETPDFRDDIITACEKETQVYADNPAKESKYNKHSVVYRRLAVVAACLVLFATGLVAGYVIPESKTVAYAETCVYIDVNPSLELTLDVDNRVISCTAANEDAELILNGMDLVGVELKTALNAIVGSMYVNGFLNAKDNSMLISVDTKDTDNTSAFLTYITNKVNEVFANTKMECSIIAQGVEANDDLIKRAHEHGISVGKMHLVDKMVGSMDEFEENDIPQLSLMSIKELNMIYSMKPRENDKRHDELISGNVGGYVEKEAAMHAALEYLGIDGREDEKEICDIFVLPAGKRIVYSVTVKFINDPTVYKCDVDCVTGEAFPAPTNGPGDLPPDAPGAGAGIDAAVKSD